MTGVWKLRPEKKLVILFGFNGRNIFRLNEIYCRLIEVCGTGIIIVQYVRKWHREFENTQKKFLPIVAIALQGVESIVSMLFNMERKL